MRTKHVWMSPSNKPRQRFLVELKYAFMLKAKGWRFVRKGGNHG